MARGAERGTMAVAGRACFPLPRDAAWNACETAVGDTVNVVLRTRLTIVQITLEILGAERTLNVLSLCKQLTPQRTERFQCSHTLQRSHDLKYI